MDLDCHGCCAVLERVITTTIDAWVECFCGDCGSCYDVLVVQRNVRAFVRTATTVMTDRVRLLDPTYTGKDPMRRRFALIEID